jgi:20S proteasome alpha/beta subunit
MTLILAIACEEEGVVIGADSASSDLEAGTKQITEKIKQIGTFPILYGGSGDAGLIQKIAEGLNSLKPPAKIKRIRQEIKGIVVPELKDSISSHVAYPAQGFNFPPAAIFLCVGVCDKIPWILEIEKDGRDTIYDADLGHFAAIGSGKPFAQALFRLHLLTKRDLGLCKIFACRILEDAIDLSSSGLSRPIFMWTISIDGKVEKLSPNDIKGISQTCELWRELEREAVGALLAKLAEASDTSEALPASESAAKIPLPPRE